MCRSGCKTGGHGSWGACARAARIAVWGPERKTHLAGDAEVDLYNRAWSDGLDPENVDRASVMKAYRQADLADSLPKE